LSDHKRSGGDLLDIAVFLDAPEENWPSMDLAGEMLLEQWRSNLALGVAATRKSIRIPSLARRIAGDSAVAFNADRALARYVAYPLRALAARRSRRLFHVVDHSYAQLVHALPRGRTGVYCHDLDAFRPLLSLESEQHSRSKRALARILLEGIRAAAVVFHSTREVGRMLEDRALVLRSRLVMAPYGVAPEFHARQDPNDRAEAVLSSLAGRPFLLHVGSGIARKRLDVLFDVFARVRAHHPNLVLVQQGAELSPAQRMQVERLAIRDAFVQPPKLDRTTLAGLYRRASAVLVTSDAEGFGFPVIEALACGAPVLASDLPALREVGSNAALYVATGDVAAWTATVRALLDDPLMAPPITVRTEQAGRFTWSEHARTIRDAYDAIRPIPS
jgi:glycosyltransferase involved in cell wall biosynthesis